MGPMDWFKGASSFDLNLISNISLRLQSFLFFIPTCSPKANMGFLNFYINYINIRMCNSSKCWFKHPLPYMLGKEG